MSRRTAYSDTDEFSDQGINVRRKKNPLNISC